MTTQQLTTIEHYDESELWSEAAQRWLEAAEQRRGSAKSRVEYQKRLKLFFQFLEGKHPAAVTGADCQRWAAAMQAEGLSKSTINSRLGAVSSFYNFACKKFEAEPGRYLHNFNPASAAQRQHINPYEKSQGLTPEQTRALLAACDRSTIKGARDFALLSFYIFTGRRRAEIARLTWSDLREGSELGALEYHYIGKGGKGGWRELPAPVWSALKTYLVKAGRLNSMKPDSPLFVSTKPGAVDNPIAEQTVNQVLDYATKRAGLGHVKVHGLRHTAAKLRRRAGSTLEEVSQFLDHSNIATTQIYLGAMEAKKDKGWQQVESLLGLD